jgi:pyruvate/2-oxoglutarate dehydrogenase complex dihydrolipoamide dehydrogenase (E3) component
MMRFEWKKDTATVFSVLPEDSYNDALVANVRPQNWINPKPKARYDMVVIGAGAAGLVTAVGAAGLGAETALVEKDLLGGDCLIAGCVPSKSLIRSARVRADIAGAGEFGIQTSVGVDANFSDVMERMRRIRARISVNDSAKRLSDLGVDVFLGEARFSGKDSIEVDGRPLFFSKAVIAAGARAVHPPIDGLAQTGFLTNETVFSLTELPKRLVVIGGGPLGCELAQAFCRLGSQVTILHKNNRIMDKEDAEAVEVLQRVFIREGVQLMLGCTIKRVREVNDGKAVAFDMEGKERTITVDAILVGVGRSPNVEGLDLEAAGVEYDKRNGVKVNDYLQTSNNRIYAAGDICMKRKFTHAADAAARIVIQNALFAGRKKLSDLTIPWCTYTDPEIAHVGMYERDARKQGMPVETYTKHLDEIDRALTDGEEEGFVKVHVKAGSDKILGATVVARHAGEMLNEITLAMVGKLGLKTLSNVIHPYPTQSEAVRRVADMYNHSRLTPLVKKILSVWLRWRR